MRDPMLQEDEKSVGHSPLDSAESSSDVGPDVGADAFLRQSPRRFRASLFTEMNDDPEIIESQRANFNFDGDTQPPVASSDPRGVRGPKSLNLDLSDSDEVPAQVAHESGDLRQSVEQQPVAQQPVAQQPVGQPEPAPTGLAEALRQRKAEAAQARGPEPEAPAPRPVGKAGSRSALLDKMIGAGEWLGKGVGMVKEANDTTGLYGKDIPEVVDRIGESSEGLRSGADSVLERYAPVQEWMQRAHGVTDAANKFVNPLPKVSLGKIGHEEIKLGVGTKEVLGLATGVAKVAQYHKNEGADPLATAGSERAAVDASQMQFRRALEARRRAGRLYDKATGPVGGRDPISTPDGRVQDLLGREKQRANLMAMQKGMRLALRAGELGKAQEKKGVRPLNEYSMEQTAYLNDREFVPQKPLGFFEDENKRRWAPKKGMLNAEGEIKSAAELAGPAGQSVFDRYGKATKGEPVPEGLMPGMRERDDLAALPDGYREDIEGGRSKQKQVAAFRFAKRAGELAEGTLNSDRMVRDGRYGAAYAAKAADAALTTGTKSAASAAQAGLLLGTGGVAAPLIAAAEAGKTLAFHGKEQLGLGLQWTAEKAEGLVDPKGLAKEQDNRDLYNKHFGLTKPAAGGERLIARAQPPAGAVGSERSSVVSYESDSDDVVSTESEIRAEQEREVAQYRAMLQGLDRSPQSAPNAGGSPDGSPRGSMELSDNGSDGLTTIPEESEDSDTSESPRGSSTEGTAVHPLFQQASAPQPIGEYDPVAELMNRKHEYFGMPPEEFQAAQQQRNPKLAAPQQLEQQLEQEAQPEQQPVAQAEPAPDPLADPTARAQDIRTRGIHWEKQGDRSVVGRRKKTWGRAIKDATWGGVTKVGKGLLSGLAAVATLPIHAAQWGWKGLKGIGSLFTRKKKDTSNPARNALTKLQAESKMGDLDRPQFDWSSISQADISAMSKEEQYQLRMQREKYDEVFGTKAHAGAARVGGTRQAAKDALMAKPEMARAQETAALREQLAPGPNTPRMASGEILEMLRGRAQQEITDEEQAGRQSGSGGPGGGGPGDGGPAGQMPESVPSKGPGRRLQLSGILDPHPAHGGPEAGGADGGGSDAVDLLDQINALESGGDSAPSGQSGARPGADSGGRPDSYRREVDEWNARASAAGIGLIMDPNDPWVKANPYPVRRGPHADFDANAHYDLSVDAAGPSNPQPKPAPTTTPPQAPTRQRISDSDDPDLQEALRRDAEENAHLFMGDDAMAPRRKRGPSPNDYPGRLSVDPDPEDVARRQQQAQRQPMLLHDPDRASSGSSSAESHADAVDVGESGRPGDAGPSDDFKPYQQGNRWYFGPGEDSYIEEEDAPEQQPSVAANQSPARPGGPMINQFLDGRWQRAPEEEKGSGQVLQPPEQQPVASAPVGRIDRPVVGRRPRSVRSPAKGPSMTAAPAEERGLLDRFDADDAAGYPLRDANFRPFLPYLAGVTRESNLFEKREFGVPTIDVLPERPQKTIAEEEKERARTYSKMKYVDDRGRKHSRMPGAGEEPLPPKKSWWSTTKLNPGNWGRSKPSRPVQEQQPPQVTAPQQAGDESLPSVVPARHRTAAPDKGILKTRGGREHTEQTMLPQNLAAQQQVAGAFEHEALASTPFAAGGALAGRYDATRVGGGGRTRMVGLDSPASPLTTGQMLFGVAQKPAPDVSPATKAAVQSYASSIDASHRAESGMRAMAAHQVLEDQGDLAMPNPDLTGRNLPYRTSFYNGFWMDGERNNPKPTARATSGKKVGFAAGEEPVAAQQRDPNRKFARVQAAHDAAKAERRKGIDAELGAIQAKDPQGWQRARALGAEVHAGWNQGQAPIAPGGQPRGLVPVAQPAPAPQPVPASQPARGRGRGRPLLDVIPEAEVEDSESSDGESSRDVQFSDEGSVGESGEFAQIIDGRWRRVAEEEKGI